MKDYPIFLDNIRSMDKVLQSLKHAPSWSIEGKVNSILQIQGTYPEIDVLSNSDDKNLFLKAEFS